MILQTQQKKLLLDSLTEKESPFRPTKTTTIFKNTANLSLRGTTYDAKHMENFLQSEYCNKTQTQSQHQQSRSITGKKDGSSPFKNTVNSYSVRPSVAFITMSRDQQKQQHYVDLYDGPSSLQKRDAVPTLQEKTCQKSIYDVEKEQHLSQLNQTMESLKAAQDKLTNQDGSLKSPSQRRKELLDLKQKFEEYNNFKTQHIFQGKRDRILKGGWRHGITGVEDADSHNISSIYQDQSVQKDYDLKQREAINYRRRKSMLSLFLFIIVLELALGMATSNQIELGGEDSLKRNTTIGKQEEKVVSIADSWKSKGRSQRFHSLNTHDRLFMPSESRDPQNRYIGKVSLDRTMKLREEEQKGKQFNIINGQSEGTEKWIGAFKDAAKSYGNNQVDLKEQWKARLQL